MLAGLHQATRPLNNRRAARTLWVRASRVLLIVLAVATPHAARADWLFGGYMGAAGTSSNTLTVSPAAGAPFSIPDVGYKGQAFRSPWYYGVRVGWLPAATQGIGVEVEWNHAKAIAQIDPRSSDLNAFQQSHGLNFLLGNVAYRFSPGCSGRCTCGRARRRGHLDTARRIDIP